MVAVLVLLTPLARAERPDKRLPVTPLKKPPALAAIGADAGAAATAVEREGDAACAHRACARPA